MHLYVNFYLYCSSFLILQAYTVNDLFLIAYCLLVRDATDCVE